MLLMEIKNLKVSYKTRRGILQAVDGISFEIQQGENLGLIGESGCGKSTVVKSILRLLPRSALMQGEVNFQGQNLLKVKGAELDQLRWRDIAYIPQSAMNALDPVIKIGKQLSEAMTSHEPISRKKAWQKAAALFELVGLDSKRLNHYPHQFSGGMRQRSVIAMSLALKPKLIIADEPTTGLDVLVQDQILTEIEKIHKNTNASVMFVTHDIGIVAEGCHRIAVMYAGKIVEYADTESLFARPFHPYTLGLMNAYPSVYGPRRELISIPGGPPDQVDPPPGCKFSPRCPFSLKICHSREPELVETGIRNKAACHRIGEIEYLRQEAGKARTWKQTMER